MRVVIIEPSAAVRARIREMIEEAGAGIEIVEAERVGPELERAHAGAVLLDVHPPDGLALLTEARERMPSALIVVLTNDTSDHYRRGCLARGADHFFDKSREFERAVRVVLDHRV